jgi:hypothetical protein
MRREEAGAETDYSGPPVKGDDVALAAAIAAGIGSLVLGIVTVWAEASEGFADAMRWWTSVGPLSGKSWVGTVAFMVAALALAIPAARGQLRLNFRTGVIIFAVLMLLATLFVFPPFFQQFAPEE